jgi:hypothetical protein
MNRTETGREFFTRIASSVRAHTITSTVNFARRFFAHADGATKFKTQS